MLERFKQNTYAVGHQSSSNVWTITAQNLGYDPTGSFSEHQVQVAGIDGPGADEAGLWKVETRPDHGTSTVLTEQAINMGTEDTVLFDALFAKTIVVTVAPHSNHTSGDVRLVITSRRRR